MQCTLKRLQQEPGSWLDSSTEQDTGEVGSNSLQRAQSPVCAPGKCKCGSRTLGFWPQGLTSLRVQGSPALFFPFSVHLCVLEFLLVTTCVFLPSTCPEPCGTPAYRLDAALGLDSSSSSSDIQRHSVFTREQMAGNELPTLDRLIGLCSVHSFLTVGLLSWDR